MDRTGAGKLHFGREKGDSGGREAGGGRAGRGGWVEGEAFLVSGDSGNFSLSYFAHLSSLIFLFLSSLKTSPLSVSLSLLCSSLSSLFLSLSSIIRAVSAVYLPYARACYTCPTTHAWPQQCDR